MAAVLPHHAIQVEGKHYAAIPNPNVGRSAVDHVTKHLETAGGAFRWMQLLERVCRAAALTLKEMGHSMEAFFDGVGSKLGLAWAMLTIPRLPAVTRSAWKAITSWGEASEGAVVSTYRAAAETFHNIFDGFASWGYALSLIFGSSALKNAADVPNAVVDMTDLAMAAQDFTLAKRHLEYIDANHAENIPLRQRFTDTLREAMLRIIKSTASVVSGVLGLLVLSFGGPVLPAAALLAISMTSTIAALSAHFFKETREYEKVDFFKNKPIEIVAARDNAPAILAY